MVKKTLGHTTFGEIAVYEQEFRVLEQRFRPFSDLAEVHCRGCSTALHRVITDFGADHAFGLMPKKLHWKEARLCLVHKAGSTTPTFGATFSGTVADAGKQLYHCAVQAGFGKGTQLHAVGDGATWIADQIDEQFGAQGSYLIDFYHICDYLAAAAKSCEPNNEKTWLDKHKDLLKQNDYQSVLDE